MHVCDSHRLQSFNLINCSNLRGHDCTKTACNRARTCTTISKTSKAIYKEYTDVDNVYNTCIHHLYSIHLGEHLYSLFTQCSS